MRNPRISPGFIRLCEDEASAARPRPRPHRTPVKHAPYPPYKASRLLPAPPPQLTRRVHPAGSPPEPTPALPCPCRRIRCPRVPKLRSPPQIIPPFGRSFDVRPMAPVSPTNRASAPSLSRCRSWQSSSHVMKNATQKRLRAPPQSNPKFAQGPLKILPSRPLLSASPEASQFLPRSRTSLPIQRLTPDWECLASRCLSTLREMPPPRRVRHAARDASERSCSKTESMKCKQRPFRL